MIRSSSFAAISAILTVGALTPLVPVDGGHSNYGRSTLSVEADSQRTIIKVDEDVALDVPTPDRGQSLFKITTDRGEAVAHIPIRQVAGDERPALAYVASHDAISLTWEPFAVGGETYTVTRDGSAVATTRDARWTDRDVHGSQPHVYQVTALAASGAYASSDTSAGVAAGEDVEEVGAPREWSAGTFAPERLERGGEPLDGSRPSSASTEVSAVEQPRELSLGTTAAALPAGTSADDRIASLAAPSPLRTSSTFRYNTFIRDASASWLPCTFAEVGGGHFSGDNRNWHPEGSYRTRVDVRIPWLPGQPMTYAPSVSDTRLYNADGSLNATRNAGTSGIKVTRNFHGIEAAQFNVNHSVGNPFCAGGAITYSVMVTMSQAADYALEGSHRKAPNHEVYIRHSNLSVWYGIYHRENEGFGCLLADWLCGGRASYETNGVSIP